jgi:hypothetical protein
MATLLMAFVPLLPAASIPLEIIIGEGHHPDNQARAV